LTGRFAIVHDEAIVIIVPMTTIRTRPAWPHSSSIELAIPGIVMSDLKAKFEQAAEDVKKLPERPDNDTLLKLYALYKQGSEGDVSGPKPGFFDFVGTAKYEAWAKLKGMKGDEAMQKYTDLVKKLGG
jgi:acyl-CoA-binding protein